MDLQGIKYQVVEVVEDGVRAVRLKKRPDGGYERSDDEPVYVEVSSPEKVYASSRNGNNNRTNNMANGDNGNHHHNNNRAPLEMEDGNGNYNKQTGQNNGGCCYKCVLYWWFWACFWILAVGGVVVPVLGYMYFVEEQCETKVTQDTVALNIDTTTQGTLNVLLVMDCNAAEWDQQFTSANSLLSSVSNADITVYYDIMQYCTQGEDGLSTAIYAGNFSDFIQYTSDDTISSTDIGMFISISIRRNFAKYIN